MSRKRSNVARLNDYGVVRRRDGIVSVTEPDHLWLDDVRSVTATEYLAALDAIRADRRPRQSKPAKVKGDEHPALWREEAA